MKNKLTAFLTAGVMLASMASIPPVQAADNSTLPEQSPITLEPPALPAGATKSDHYMIKKQVSLFPMSIWNLNHFHAVHLYA